MTEITIDCGNHSIDINNNMTYDDYYFIINSYERIGVCIPKDKIQEVIDGLIQLKEEIEND